MTIGESAPLVKLNNGRSMPTLGLGTSQFVQRNGTASPSVDGTQAAVEYAIDVGYRMFDTAYNYRNEKEVGAGIRKKINEGVVKREDIFVTTKLANQFHRPERVQYAFEKSLASLGLDYVDLYLIHSPRSTKYVDDNTNFPKDAEGNILHDDVDLAETWKAMEKLVEKGLVHSIGVSNFTIGQLQHILDHCKIKPTNNQVETHAYLMQPSLFKFCKEHDITVTAYAPVGSPGRWNKSPDEVVLTKDPVVEKVAKRLGKTTSQVLIRYLIERGRIPIPRSTNPAHIKENFDVFDFQFSPVGLAELDGLDRDHRFFTRSVPATNST